MTRLQREMQRMADDNAQIERLEEAVAEKDAEIDRLRAALKPFADLASIYVRRAETFGWKDADGTLGAADAEMDRTITVGDCRAALKALEEP